MPLFETQNIPTTPMIRDIRKHDFDIRALYLETRAFPGASFAFAERIAPIIQNLYRSSSPLVHRCVGFSLIPITSSFSAPFGKSDGFTRTPLVPWTLDPASSFLEFASPSLRPLAARCFRFPLSPVPVTTDALSGVRPPADFIRNGS